MTYHPMVNKEAPTTILMLPWLAHGHITPFLELAKKLADRNLHIYICSTPILLQSIQKKIPKIFSNSIDLVPFHIPPSPELPLHYHTTNGLPPHLMVTLKKEYEKSSSQFPSILSEIQPHLVIYDFNQPWAAEMAASQNIPAVQFITVAASVLAFGLFKIQNPEKKFPFPEIYLRGKEMSIVEAHVDTDVNQIKDMETFMQAMKKSCNILLVKSCREIEGKYIDALESISGKKIVPTGPLIKDPDMEKAENPSEINHIIEWLDEKEEASVIFASFGSEYFLTEDERYEIAKGLEQSEVNFIWVIRFPVGEKITIEEALPDGFLERVKGRGLVVEGWAPQAKILEHKNTGCFLSHCGWSSVMESLKYGVPIVAMPMHIDQPLNARLVEALGVGVEAVRDEEEGKIQSMETEKAIRKVMVEESREDLRKKANELKKKLESKKDEEIDDLVVEIRNLCNKFNKQSNPEG